MKKGNIKFRIQWAVRKVHFPTTENLLDKHRYPFLKFKRDVSVITLLEANLDIIISTTIREEKGALPSSFTKHLPQQSSHHLLASLKRLKRPIGTRGTGEGKTFLTVEERREGKTEASDEASSQEALAYELRKRGSGVGNARNQSARR